MADVTPVRSNDWLINPDNAVITFIDYQPDQYAGVHSMQHEELVHNVLTLGKVAKDFDLPVVLSTVFVKRGMEGTNKELCEMLGNPPELDRTTLNSWEDPEFVEAIKATGRKKLIVAGLWTEVCVTFPVLDALQEGYEVYVVTDAIGGVSKVSHKAAIKRMIQAGAKPISVISLACELQRDWGREGADRLRGVLRYYFGGISQIKQGVY